MACMLVRYPRLWSVGSLPEASTKLVPVRTGGVLVLARHLILYHTQACPSVQEMRGDSRHAWQVLGMGDVMWELEGVRTKACAQLSLDSLLTPVRAFSC